MSGLDEKGRYCTCNSKTNPCIVCGKPKFIDPEWLKRKIEEEPDGMEVGAGFDIFSAPTSAAATPADVGEEPVAWRWKAKDAELWIYDPDAEWLRKQPDDEIDREPLYSATALEQVTRERDEARATLDEVCLSSRQEWQRATSAEAKLAEARKVIEWIRSEASSWAASYSFARRIADAARRWVEETR